MSDETKELQEAGTELAHAMSRFVRALDAVGDDGAAAEHLSEQLADGLEGLSSRVGAARSFES
jgi:hypothetical protein